MPLPWCCWCKIRPPSSCRIVTRSAAWDTSAMNAGVAFSCKRCWPYDHRALRCLDAWPRTPLCAFQPPRENNGSNGSSEKGAKAMSGYVRCRPLGRLLREASGSMSGIGGRICSHSAEACQTTQTHFLGRAGKSRRVQESEVEITYALDLARAFPSQASRPFEVPARHGRQARSTQLQLAFGQMTLLPPRNAPRASKDPVTVWVIRFCSNVASASPCFTRWHKASMDFTIPASSSWRSTFASSCRTCPAIACNRCSKSCRRRLYSSRATRLRQVGIRQALSLLFQTHTRFPEMLAPRLEFLWQPLPALCLL